MATDPLREFCAALAAAGMDHSRVIADGRIHRIRAKGEGASKRSGWYVLYLDSTPAGAFGDWRTGDVQRWRPATDLKPTLEEQRLIDAALGIAKAQRERERAETRKAAQRSAKAQWRAGSEADPMHAYLARKGVGAFGLRQRNENLLIPMRDVRGDLWAVQAIAPDGTKRFGRGARKRGLFHLIGDQTSDVLCLAEGYATAASVHTATGYPVAVAFDCSNLEPVAIALRKKYPHVLLVVCADDDAGTAQRIGRNPGIEAATAAARAVGGVIASPTIGAARPRLGMTDDESSGTCVA